MNRRAVALAGAAILVLRCASKPPEDSTHVRVTTDRALVKPCIDLAKVKTNLDDQPGENDLKRQTADLGGNVLLVYNTHEGGAFYCGTPPLEVTISGVPGPSTTPRP
jgi:hypothetical protein